MICDRFGWRFEEVDAMAFDDVIEALAAVDYLGELETKAIKKGKDKGAKGWR